MQWRVGRSQADHIRGAHPRQISKQSLVDTSGDLRGDLVLRSAAGIVQNQPWLSAKLPHKKVKSLCSTSKSQQLVAYVSRLKLFASTHRVHSPPVTVSRPRPGDFVASGGWKFHRVHRCSAIFAASRGVQSQKSDESKWCLKHLGRLDLEDLEDCRSLQQIRKGRLAALESQNTSFQFLLLPQMVL